VLADQVRVELGGLASSTHVTAVLLTGAGDGRGELLVSSGRLIAHELVHTALENARIQGLPDAGGGGSPQLSLFNLAGSGSDGVSLSLCCDAPVPTGQLDSLHADLVLAGGALSIGQSLTLKVAGQSAVTGDGSPAPFNAFLKMEADALANEITADFSSLNSSAFTVQVHLDGALVLSRTLPAQGLVGSVASDAEVSAASAGLVPIEQPQQNNTIQLMLGYSNAVTMMIEGSGGSAGSEVIGDELRVMAENPLVAIDGVSVVEMIGVDLGQITVIDEQAVPAGSSPPPPCPADIAGSGGGGGDGTVDINDLLAVITNWGPGGGGGPADISPPGGGDGTVDVNDLLAVITAWGPCKPR
jgi:hypothetical protein